MPDDAEAIDTTIRRLFVSSASECVNHLRAGKVSTEVVDCLLKLTDRLERDGLSKAFEKRLAEVEVKVLALGNVENIRRLAK